ncbi:transferrin receptor protein 2 isoform X2 [Narcine bancroftii]|uniref:transferrin receptor protein 2 isoform X2 n=1 Tax=Narcine bancroftii TaxID=1343680 RepID=UPI0038315CDB
MDQIRHMLSISKEPHSYYRAQIDTEAGGKNNLEMELPEGEALEPSTISDLTDLITRKPRNRTKALMLVVLGSLLLLVIVFLLGYVASHSSCSTCPEDSTECMAVVNEMEDSWQDTYYSSQTVLHLNDLRTMLNKNINKSHITNTIRVMSQESHPSGSAELHKLDDYVLNKFHSYKLNHVWTDSHYVTLPIPDSSSPNNLWIMDSRGVIQKKILPLDQDSYLAYSPSGNITGGLVYGHYGRQEDFNQLKALGVNVQDNIVLIRIGKISFAEKVTTAQEHGAIGVLLYPDPIDIPQSPRGNSPPRTTTFYGHVHLGTGDPFTPGFPSFNHTQFPPVESSALPRIPALTINANTASNLIGYMGGNHVPSNWRGGFQYFVKYVLGPEFSHPSLKLQMGVYRRMVPTMISNIFASIEGFIEPDRYIIIGAQRDAWGPGAAKSGVGTAILLELAHSLSEMVLNGFRPRRSILFASWDAGEYGSIGATEWLEGYMSLMHLKTVAYFSLDRAVLGDDLLVAQSSPLLHQLIEKVLKQVESPNQGAQSLYSQISSRYPNFKEKIIQHLTMDSSAYPFTAFAGIPAMEINYREFDQNYPFLNTKFDTFDRLNWKLNNRLADFSGVLAEIIGQMVIKLSHSKLLPLNYHAYSEVILKYIMQLHMLSQELKSRGLTAQWLFSARGDLVRAAERLTNLIRSSDHGEERLIRIYNNKIMRVEFYFLSQYVSVTDTPFRHILQGRGNHTLEELCRHFNMLQLDPSRFDENIFRRQLALVTWTLQGAANALSGDVWSVDNNF